MVFNCLTCCKLRGKMAVQIMADLPKDRFREAAPSTYCAIDMFGPFKIKFKWSEVKPYGAMFTFLRSRAVHIEVSQHNHWLFHSSSKKTDCKKTKCKTNTFQEWIKLCWSRARINAFSKMHQTKIQGFLQNSSVDRIKWKRNPPAVSHIGGIWECQIYSVRGILASSL